MACTCWSTRCPPSFTNYRTSNHKSFYCFSACVFPLPLPNVFRQFRLFPTLHSKRDVPVSRSGAHHANRVVPGMFCAPILFAHAFWWSCTLLVSAWPLTCMCAPNTNASRYFCTFNHTRARACAHAHWRHKPHHRFTNPRLFDAFNGSLADTFLMILVPLYVTANVISCNVWTYMAFGSLYVSAPPPSTKKSWIRNRRNAVQRLVVDVNQSILFFVRYPPPRPWQEKG